MDYLEIVLRQAGIADRLRMDGYRLDAAFTGHLEDELEFVKSQTFDVERPMLKSFDFIPIDTSVPAGAESVAWDQWDGFGKAEVIANFADDLPFVDVSKERFRDPVITIGNAYQMSWLDVRRMAMTGSGIDQRRVNRSREIIDRKLDDIAAFGMADAGITGFLNNGDITVQAATGNWPALTVDQVLTDLNVLENKIHEDSKETFAPNTLLLPTSRFNFIKTKRIGTDTSETILESFLRNSTNISQVAPWHKLETAGAGSVKRALAYDRNPNRLSLPVPVQFESLSPQARNLALVVPNVARIGAVQWYYPVSALFMDGI